jgi:hypothetical protein
MSRRKRQKLAGAAMFGDQSAFLQGKPGTGSYVGSGRPSAAHNSFDSPAT